MSVMTLNFRQYWQWRNADSAFKCHYGTLRDTVNSLSPGPQDLRLAGTFFKTCQATIQFQAYFPLLIHIELGIVST
jgi:hypothetical protein